MTILDTIIAAKKEEVARCKREKPLTTLTQSPYMKEAGFSLKRALCAPKSSGIIAEHKRKSPSLGWIHPQSDVVAVTQGYVAGGAAALSVLTDAPFFGGSLSDLSAARRAVNAPILRKDFVIDPYQLFEAKAVGADVILLIAECLSAKEVKELAETAQNLGLEVLMELHSADQLDKVCEAVDCVGINNRNLKNFDVSLQTSIDLSAQIPDRFVKVAESGISKPESIALLRGYGFQGFLIGEAFMKTADPSAAIQQFIAQIDLQK